MKLNALNFSNQEIFFLYWIITSRDIVNNLKHQSRDVLVSTGKQFWFTYTYIKSMSSPAYIEVYHISYTLPQGQQYITIMHAENTHTIGVLYIHQQMLVFWWRKLTEKYFKHHLSMCTVSKMKTKQFSHHVSRSCNK